MKIKRINGTFFNSTISLGMVETLRLDDVEGIIETKRSIGYYYEFLSTYFIKSFAGKQNFNISVEIFLSDIDALSDKISFYYYADVLCKFAKVKNIPIKCGKNRKCFLDISSFDVDTIGETLYKIYLILCINNYCKMIDFPNIDYLEVAIETLKDEIEEESIRIADTYNKLDDLNIFVSFVNKMKGFTAVQKRCVAIITSHRQTFYAISGFGNDIYSKELHAFLDKQHRDETKKTIKAIVADLELKDWKWCHLSSKVLRYIESPKSSKAVDYQRYKNNANLNELIMLKKPSTLKDFLKLADISKQDGWKRNFTCAERKILAKIKPKDMIVYSKYPPCIGCQPALLGVECYAYNGNAEIERVYIVKENVVGYPFRCYNEGEMLLREVQ